jgi:hypothetical protein
MASSTFLLNASDLPVTQQEEHTSNRKTEA